MNHQRHQQQPIQPSATVCKAVHYSNISHATAHPALQLKFLEKLHRHNKLNNLPIPHGNENFCSSCKVMFIPGFNVSIRVIYEKRKEKQVAATTNNLKMKRERVLRYKCLCCNHNNDHKNILHNHSPVVLPKVEVKKDFKAEWVPPHEKLKQQVKAKNRSQKRKKMNDLNLLLSNKKKNEAKKKMSLDLMDFMK